MAAKITVGTEDKKKVAILVGLLVVAAVVFWINSDSGTSTAPPPATAARPAVPIVSPQRNTAPASPQTDAPPPSAGPRVRGGRLAQEFKPSLKPRKPEERPAPETVDPALRLDILAKLQNVNVEGARRNVFEFGSAPPPPVASTKPKPPVPSPLVAGNGGQPGAEAQPTTPPPPPPPPRVPLKFFGFVNPQGVPVKRAFFLDGEDIHVVNEGDTVKRRYKIVRIGVNSVVVEDLDFRNQQTVPLEEAPAG